MKSKKNKWRLLFKVAVMTILIFSCKEQEKSNLENLLATGNLDALKQERNRLGQERDKIMISIELISKAIADNDSILKLSLVSIKKISYRPFAHFIEVQGNVKTNQNIVIAAEYMGTLKKIYCKEGQYVKKGTTLALIDDGGLKSQLEQTKIKLQLVKTTYERQKRLWDKKIGSEIQFLRSKTDYESLKNQYKQVENQYGKTIIKAPFSGIIDDIINPEGASISLGMPIFRIVNLNNMYTEVDVPERYLLSVKKSTEVEVSLPVIHKNINSSIRQVSNFINPSNRAFKVEVAIPNKDGEVKPNLTAKVKIKDYYKDEAIVIPENLLQVSGANETFVYLVKSLVNGEGIVERVLVEKGKHSNGEVEILSGIENGQFLLTEGAKMVSSEQKVKVLYSE